MATFEEIERHAQQSAGPDPESYLYWLHDGDHGEVFCGDCVFALPALPGLVVCSLLMLCGHAFGPRPHVRKEDDDRCSICADSVGRLSGKCLSVPEQIASEVNEQRDGGWRGEEDSLRTCDNEDCGARLDVCLTGYGAFEEFRHWEHYGPPDDARDWQAFCEMLNSLEDEHRPGLFALWSKWEASGKLVSPDRTEQP